MKMIEPTITHRGWQGHFCCPCKFHLNTLIEYGDTAIVVSTVGLYIPSDSKEFDTIGHDRHFETMAFHADDSDDYRDADVTKEVEFDSEWSIFGVEKEIEADEMHRKVVNEVARRLRNGDE